VPPTYDDAGPFAEGLAPVAMTGRWGFIDMKGSFAVNPRFDRVALFRSGLAVVWSDGRRDYIDTHGKFVRAVIPAGPKTK